MGKLIDMTGQVCGRLTVLRRAEQKSKSGQKAKWVCQCECGNIVEVVGTSLRNGATQSCGCLQKERTSQAVKKDLTGQRFNRLLVLEQTNSKNGHAMWKCQCDCGAITEAQGSLLLSKITQSCGCLQKERTSESSRHHLEGLRFGNLLVLEHIGSDKNQHSLWRCLCDCGNETIALGYTLIQGSKSSCGCIRSRGEAKIGALLLEANIPFVKEKRFADCMGDKTALRFDFYVNDSYLIEYDGEQHFQYRNSGWDTEENFKERQRYDKIKNDYCRAQHIPLIRIPYTKLGTLCLEDLLLDTTKYLI